MSATRVLHRGQHLFWLGLALLAACLVGAELIGREPRGTLLRLVREGLVITGWVALWRPRESLLYDWWPLLHERRTFDRLTTPAVEVRVE